MIEKIGEKVSVLSIYDQNKGKFLPKKIKWRSKTYEINQVGYHHRLKEGKKLIHIFSVCSNDLSFKLRLDTDNLSWTLEEVADGLSN